MSLNDSTVAVMLPISDPDRAQKFYADQLGLPYQGPDMEGGPTFGLGGGGTLVLLHRPEEKPLSSTAMSFEVGDVAREISDLESRGVTFEDYDMPGLKTEHHIASMGAEKAAWFLDPDGNVLCLHQRG
ncbi:catechol 2,3-dioxygenase-like lactoylglutathione lyase family enzyme [Marmoricola sp. URHA0025 HA25]